MVQQQNCNGKTVLPQIVMGKSYSWCVQTHLVMHEQYWRAQLNLQSHKISMHFTCPQQIEEIDTKLSLVVPDIEFLSVSCEVDNLNRAHYDLYMRTTVPQDIAKTKKDICTLFDAMNLGSSDLMTFGERWDDATEGRATLAQSKVETTVTAKQPFISLQNTILHQNVESMSRTDLEWTVRALRARLAEQE